MTPEDEKTIAQWNDELGGEVTVTLRLTDDDRASDIESFCRAAARLATHLELMQEEGDSEDLPAIEVGDQAVVYHAVPSGTKLLPFLESIRRLSGAESAGKDRPSPVDDHTSDRLKALEVPAFLRLFVAPNCPFCPVVTRQVVSLAAASPLVRVSIIDGTFFSEVAESEGVRSAPTLLLDTGFRWTGQVNLDEVVEAMTQRDPAELSADVLEGMLKAGNGSELIDMMLAREMIFPGLIDLLTRDKIFVRVGAMMVMEEIAHRRKEIAAQMAEPLWNRFFEAGDAVQGDILHVLGEIGDERLLPRLERILAGDYDEEIKEAAREAIEKITSR